MNPNVRSMPAPDQPTESEVAAAVARLERARAEVVEALAALRQMRQHLSAAVERIDAVAA